MTVRDPKSPNYLVEIVVTDPSDRIVKRRREGRDTVNGEQVLASATFATQTLRGDAPLIETERGYTFDQDGVYDVRVNVYVLLAP